MSDYIARVMQQTAPKVPELLEFEQDTLNELWGQWAAKQPRNAVRKVYWDLKNKLKDFRISIPPQLSDRLNVVSGWAAKAVSEPANRTIWEGLIGADGKNDPLEIESLLEANSFRVEFPQAVRAGMAHSTAFISTTPGVEDLGEPPVVMQFHSAMHATGLWDQRKRALRAGLVIHQSDYMGTPTLFTLMLPYANLTVQSSQRGWFIIDEPQEHHLGRVALDQLPTTPDLDRPFGRARIDRVVMSIVDRAVRGGSRLDVHSEMFSAMKLILLGVGEDAFQDENGDMMPLWSWYSGRLNTLNRDEEGELPRLEKIAAESPEPHIATMRQLASEFSGHTGVPLGSLGIAQDNPESADAKNVAREDMIFMVEQQQTVYTNALRRAFGNAVMLRDRLSEVPDELLSAEFAWRQPDRASKGSMADAGMKQVTAAGLEGTRVGMRMMGMSRHQIDQAMNEKRRSGATALLERLAGDTEALAGAEAAAE